MKFEGTFATATSGSLAGITASHNRFGQYLRERAIPVNPNSAFQQDVRGFFAQLSSRWVSTLTVAQRAAWETYASNVAGNLTGLNWYVACNTLRLQAGLTIVDVAPVTFSQATITPVTIVVDVSDNNIEVNYTGTDDWNDTTGGALLVFQSRQFSPSVNFRTQPYRFVNALLGNTGAPPTSPFDNVPIFAITAGNRVGIRVRACFADGRISPPTDAVITIQA